MENILHAIVDYDDLGIVEANEIILVLSEPIEPLFHRRVSLLYVMTARGILGWIDDLAILQESKLVG